MKKKEVHVFPFIFKIKKNKLMLTRKISIKICLE